MLQIALNLFIAVLSKRERNPSGDVSRRVGVSLSALDISLSKAETQADVTSFELSHMTTSIIKPIYKSILRWTTDLITDLNALGTLPLIEYESWESRFDENTLPQTTLLGIDGFSFSENRGLWEISFALGLSSHKDANLLHEIDILDEIQIRTGEGSKIPLLEMNLGEEVSELNIFTWQLLPMAQSELRNYRTIGIEAHRTGS
jgi:hypothetical protein